MFNIVLFQPEIPPNTGNIIRLCANAGANLHLIKPLGFAPDDKQLRRAGLDYHDWTAVKQYDDFEAFLDSFPNVRIFAYSTKGTQYYTDINYQVGDALLFGPETRGLPATLLNHTKVASVLRVPMIPNNRSLNLSNTAAIVLYEAWRQLGFENAK